jgi:hypothetical protein
MNAGNSMSGSFGNRSTPGAVRRRLGYFYSEYRGIHDNYARHLDFIEREILPRAVIGVEAFYPDGEFDPAILTRIELLEEFVDDLDAFSKQASELADELEVLLDLD